MNVWRGLFRAWILASVLWALFVAFITYSQIISVHLPRNTYTLDGADLELREYPDYVAPEKGYRTVKFPNDVYVHVAPSIGDDKYPLWRPRFIEQYVDPRVRERQELRMDRIKDALAFMLIPIGGLFSLGLSVRWVVQGFRATR